ncbi:MAG TPA: NAD-dependent epimerase/dehydratase family protein [Solirubrobacteraceae bacterium]|nr:NAD-dependent epimerase/dehydratase family protein [Solirubrobacteraceae bacterium]
MPPAKKSSARAARRTSARGLVVAVTGPTGEIGRSFVSLLDRSPQVASIRGMARSPFDTAAHGWTKVDYHQGDILDRAAVEHLVAGADVVVHLAFIVLAAGESSRGINLEGSRNVFEAAAAAKARRLVYTSSVAAYGFSDDLPELLTEDTPALGFERHPYSAQKAEVERELRDALAGSSTAAYVFRPCIVAGPDAPVLVNAIPFIHLGERLPGAVRELFDQVSVLKPVLPDPGTPFQLVHHDDVAAALCAGVLGTGTPGVYNLAAEGTFTFSDLAHELGWYSIPVPDLTVDATAEIVARLPFLPDEATWIQALRHPVLMDTTRARSELRWRPQHDTLQTLHETVTAWRADLDATGPVRDLPSR